MHQGSLMVEVMLPAHHAETINSRRAEGVGGSATANAVQEKLTEQGFPSWRGKDLRKV